MKIFLVLVISILLFCTNTSGNDTTSYSRLLKTADSLTKLYDFAGAARVGDIILDSVNNDKHINDSLHAKVLTQVGNLLYNSGDYNKSEELYSRSLKIRMNLFGKDHLETVESEIGLANIFNVHALFDKAEPLYQHALKIREKYLGKAHEKVIETIRLLGQLQKNLGNYNEANIYFLRGLELAESNDDPQNYMIVKMLNELALLSKHQRYVKKSTEYSKRIVA